MSVESDENPRQFTIPEDDVEWRSFPDGIETPGEAKDLLAVDGGPRALLVKIGPNGVVPRHYHTENQWQIFLEGDCEFEGEHVEPMTVHYADANAQYGPIVAGDDGVVFLTLRENHPAGYHPVEEGLE